VSLEPSVASIALQRHADVAVELAGAHVATSFAAARVERHQHTPATFEHAAAVERTGLLAILATRLPRVAKACITYGLTEFE
jgi:hypothetical protein